MRRDVAGTWHGRTTASTTTENPTTQIYAVNRARGSITVQGCLK